MQVNARLSGRNGSAGIRGVRARVSPRALRRAAVARERASVDICSRHGEFGLVLAPVRRAGDLDCADPRHAVGGQLSRRRGSDVPRRSGASVRATLRSAERARRSLRRSCSEIFRAHRESHSEVVPNIIDLERFRPARSRASRRMPRTSSSRATSSRSTTSRRRCARLRSCARRCRCAADRRRVGPERRAPAIAGCASSASADAVDFCGRLDRDADGRRCIAIGDGRAQSEPRRQHAEFGAGGDGERRARGQHECRRRAVHRE